MNNNTNKISAKDIHIWIKRGMTVEQAMEQLGLNSEEELKVMLQRLAPMGAKDMYRQLKRNEKIKKTTSGSITDNVIESETEEHKEENKVQEMQVLNQEEQVQIPQTEKSSTELLNEALQKEEQQSLELQKLENEHKACMQSRLERMHALQTKKKEIESLRETLKGKREEISNLKFEYDDLALKMQNLDEKIRIVRTQLDDLREEIHSLRVVSIFIYEDGSIESESELAFSEEEETQFFTELVNLPEMEDMTIKQIKTLARLKAILKTLERGEKEYSLVFEEQKLEKYFETTLNQ